VPVNVAPPAIGGEGPQMMAVDLVGEDFYWWMAEYPEACHKLMDKITKAMLAAELNFRKVDPSPRWGFGLAEDSAQIASTEMFREFVVPYDNILYDNLGAGMKDGRGMHMCGNSMHLHQSLIEDLRISSFNIFGYMVPPKIAAERFGGHTYLWGNVNPMLMLDGTVEEVRAEAMECLKWMAPCGGYALGDGANVCPGTPLENLAVLTEAAEEYAKTRDQRQ
jgi:uroporphyrinogen-III decarboxylase